MGDAKSLFDRISRELTEVTLIEANLRRKKWDAEGMIEYLTTNTEQQKLAVKALTDAWAKSVSFAKGLDGTDLKLDAVKVKAEADSLEALTQDTKKSYDVFKKTVLVEVGNHKK